MVETSVAFVSPAGLHARPAAELSEMAKAYSGVMLMIHGDKTANMKSVIHMLSLGIKKGSRVTVQVEGDGEQTMSDRVREFIINLID